jgi:glucosamine-6-phosphate deaminase
MQNFIKDKLLVKIYETRAEMGAAAGKEVSDCIKELLAEKPEINMIFAAAPSQNEVLDYLANDKTIPWEKINAFHMDEYVGIDPVAPQGFARFLKNALFEKVPFKTVNTLDSLNDPDAEAVRYSKLLEENPVDIVCMGIGENGHIAFNDPHVADFNDSSLVKKVDLDEVCRMQQVHDGCFACLDDVPKYALTLTVPALAAGKYQFCVVPAATKANAVKNTVNGEINEACPATILRTLDNATLYCDNDSGALIK